MEDRYIKARVTRRTNIVILRAEDIYEITLGGVRISYDYDDVVEKAWAEAGPDDDGVLAINYSLELARKRTEIFLAEVVPHEVAHLVICKRPDLQKKNGHHHCRGWRAVARALGAKATVPL